MADDISERCVVEVQFHRKVPVKAAGKT